MNQVKEEDQKDKLSFVDYLLNKGCSESTVARYLRDKQRFEKWAEQENVPIESVRYSDVLNYIQGEKDSVQQITISTFLNGLKHYYSYLIEEGVVKENPVSQVKIKGIKRKKLYTILSKKELEELYHKYTIKEEIEAHQNKTWYKASLLSNKRNKVIIGLMIYQGLNTTELTRLTEKDVQLRAGKIFISGTRRSNERELKLESVQILDLMEYTLKTRQELLSHKKLETNQFLVSTSGSLKINNTLFQLVQQLQKINPQVQNLKQIRASVITHWLKLYNLREVQYMAGHRYVSSTEAYQVNNLEDLQTDIDQYHPL